MGRLRALAAVHGGGAAARHVGLGAGLGGGGRAARRLDGALQPGRHGRAGQAAGIGDAGRVGRGGLAAQRQRLLVLPGQLPHQHVGQADAFLGQVLAGLLVQHGGEHLGLLVVQHALARRRFAHALHHHVDEHGLELGGGAFQRVRRAGVGALAQRGRALDVGGQGGAEVVGAGGGGAGGCSYHGGVLK
jgi:hypothetical protein